jgi:tRNA1(Val) A37 N6-methylase TrmN6
MSVLKSRRQNPGVIATERLLFFFLSCPQPLSSHPLNETGRLHHAIETDRGDLLVTTKVAAEIFIGWIFDAKTFTNKVAHRLGLKLPRGVRQATPIRPPLVVRCAQMAAIKMRQLVNKSCISRFC